MSVPPARVHPVMSVLLTAWTLAGAVRVHAAEPSRAPPVLDRRLRATLIDSLSAQVMRNYVEADTAKMITDYVRRRLKAGAYDSVSSSVRFAELVTGDLRHVNGDLHLSLRWDPEGPGPAGGPTIVRGPGPSGPGGPGPVVVQVPGPGAPGGPGECR